MTELASFLDYLGSMKHCAWKMVMGLAMGFGVVGCSDKLGMLAGQPTDNNRVACLGDPDAPGQCTLWTCQTVPAQYAYKTHCSSPQPTGMPKPAGSYLCPETGEGIHCPGALPTEGSTPGGGSGPWNCMASEGYLSCDVETGTPPPPSDSAGCTLTQGFWKNHEEVWPVSSLEIGGVVYTKAELLDLFRTAPMGDASVILAHQLMAAMLNQKSGAGVPTAVTTAFGDAQSWMANHKDADGRLPYGTASSSPEGQQATSLSSTLDSYNNGGIGPKHCK